MLNRACVALRTYGFGKQRGIPSLDGLRAVSIALVLTAHLDGTHHFVLFRMPADLGEFGVRMFFIISGYLITSILLAELGRKGSISLRRFYFRRTLRLFPASYFFIGVTVALAAAGVIELARRDLICGITYTMDYVDNRGWPMGHLWSLAVEEQFYLLWPLTLRSLRISRSKKLLLGVLAVVPFLRLIVPFVAPVLDFVRWSDALATGCLLALLREELNNMRAYSRLLRSRWFFLVPLTAFAAACVPFWKVQMVICETVTNIGLAISIDWAMRNTTGLVGRFLNQPTVSFIGVLSYSLYLWQQPFLNRGSGAPYCAFPLNIVLAFAAALISYVAIEAPFLRLRGALEQRWRKARAEGAQAGGVGRATAVAGSVGPEYVESSRPADIS
jgi:peptidoglycan/LPS O-acetylase OafA/YrhL